MAQQYATRNDLHDICHARQVCVALKMNQQRTHAEKMQILQKERAYSMYILATCLGPMETLVEPIGT